VEFGKVWRVRIPQRPCFTAQLMLREESRGLHQESYIEEPDGLVSVNLLIMCAVSAFTTGAALSALMICWLMTFKHWRCSRGGASSQAGRRHADREQCVLGHGCSSSTISVTRISGVDAQMEELFTNGWTKSGEIQDPGLPTPEQTPLQHKRPVPDVHDHAHLHQTDSDWEQSQTFITQTGPNASIMYLSSGYLHGGDGGQQDDPTLPNVERQRYLILPHPAIQKDQSRHHPAPKAHNSAGDYRPVTPQDSPERRKVVSAPNPHSDYSNPLHWSQNNISNNAKPNRHHHNYPIQPRTNAALVRPAVLHANRGLGELQDFSHVLGRRMDSERDVRREKDRACTSNRQ
ncbi:semaphorin-6B, partial [Tachysurus ichikawai]